MAKGAKKGREKERRLRSSSPSAMNRRHAKAVLDELEQAGVKNCWSRCAPSRRPRRPGFSKNQLAEAGLDERGIAYLHLRGLGTPKEGREGGAQRRNSTGCTRFYSKPSEDATGQGRARRAVGAGAESGPICILCYVGATTGIVTGNGSRRSSRTADWHQYREPGRAAGVRDRHSGARVARARKSITTIMSMDFRRLRQEAHPGMTTEILHSPLPLEPKRPLPSSARSRRRHGRRRPRRFAWDPCQQQARPPHVDALADPQFQFAVLRVVEIGEQRRGGGGVALPVAGIPRKGRWSLDGTCAPAGRAAVSLPGTSRV